MNSERLHTNKRVSDWKGGRKMCAQQNVQSIIVRKKFSVTNVYRFTASNHS